MSRSVTFQRFLCMAIAALIISQYEIAHSLALDKSASRNPIQDELTFEQAVKSAKDFLAVAKDQETDFTEQLARYSGAKGIIYTLDLVDCLCETKCQVVVEIEYCQAADFERCLFDVLKRSTQAEGCATKCATTTFG